MEFEQNLLMQECKTARICNYVLIVVRIVTLYIFFFYKAYIMGMLTSISLIIYLICIHILKKKKLVLFVNVIFFDLTIYSLLANLLIGYNFGYHIYIFFLIPLIYYSEYITNIRKHFKIKTNLYVVVAMVLYFINIGILKFLNPLYTDFPNLIVNIIYCINTLCAFIYIYVYLNRFIKIIKTMEEKLHDKAEIDELTGLYNRYKARDVLMDNYNEYKNLKKEKWIGILDIDNFKKINDIYGHNCGDLVLKELSNIAKKVANNNFDIFRWGGEEFLIVGNYNDNTINLVDNLRKEIENYNFVYQNKNLKVTVTIGCSVLKKLTNIANWIEKADKSLYIGKNSTKNCVIWDKNRIN